MPLKIGRYEISHEIARGGMAVVYLATDPLVSRHVAIKVLSSKLTDPDYLVRFQREAEVIAALEHANIVPVYDFGEHDKQPYIVMRHMPGGTLKERLGRKPLPLGALAPVISRVAAALDAAHARNVIHRDLKPGNILFDGEDQAFLADFGIAKNTESSEDLTGDALIGTPKYFSPEQVRGQKLDGRSDIYALGVVLFEALAGKPPFVGDSAMGTAAAHLVEPIPKVAKINRDLPASAQQIIDKALAKKPEDRYARAADLARDVKDLASGRWYVLKL